MLVAKSQKEPGLLRYLFEADQAPVTVERLTAIKDIGSTSSIEATLTLSRDQTPIQQKEHDALKAIMKDCGHPELRVAYEEGYDTMILFLKYCGVDGETYRIHTIRKQV